MNKFLLFAITLPLSFNLQAACEGKEAVVTTTYTCKPIRNQKQLTALKVVTVLKYSYYTSPFRGDTHCRHTESKLNSSMNVKGAYQGIRLDSGNSAFVMEDLWEGGLKMYKDGTYNVGGKKLYFNLGIEFGDGPGDDDYMTEIKATLGLSKDPENVPFAENNATLPVFKCEKKSVITKNW